MAATFRTGSDVYSLANPANITNATGHAAGDIIVIVASYYSALPPGSFTVSGFTSFLKVVDTTGPYVMFEFFWKLDGGSEPSSYSYTTDAGYTDIVCFAMTGCDPTNPIGITSSAFGFSGAGSPLVIPTMTVPLANSFLIGGFNSYGNPAVSPYPITWIPNRGDGTFTLMGEAVGAGATGSKSITETGSAISSCGGMVAFQPPATPASGPFAFPTYPQGASRSTGPVVLRGVRRQVASHALAPTKSDLGYVFPRYPSGRARRTGPMVLRGRHPSNLGTQLALPLPNLFFGSGTTQ